MSRITQEEFVKMYGKETLSKFKSPVKREGRFSDIGEDIQSGFKGTLSDIAQRGRNILDSASPGTQLEQSPIETIGQIAGETVGAGLDVGARAVSTLGSFFLKPEEEKLISDKFSSAIEATGLPQFIGRQTPRTQRNIQAGLSFMEIGALKGVSRHITSRLKQADEVLEGSRLKNPAKSGVAPAAIQRLIKDARFQVSDINPQVETALKRSDFDEVNRYFQAARSAASDTRKPTPLELAGGRAEEAFDVIDDARKKATQGKRAILDEVGDQNVPGNMINDVMAEGIQRMNSQFGVRINADGTIDEAAGRVSKLDPVDQKLVNDYFNRLNGLGVSPTLREVDDFVDWAQSQLYKQSKNLSTLESADRAVVAQLKGITGDLNGRLKVEVGSGYGEVNARLSQLIELQDELSRSLGADARKGGGLVKRLFSPTGGRTREIFELIRQETGIDLDKEANLARFTMDSAGDVRQKSLLQQLNAGFGDAQQLDLTKPVSIINFIRERADLDAQELANEIIRRANEGLPQ